MPEIMEKRRSVAEIEADVRGVREKLEDLKKSGMAEERKRLRETLEVLKAKLEEARTAKAEADSEHGDAT